MPRLSKAKTHFRRTYTLGAADAANAGLVKSVCQRINNKLNGTPANEEPVDLYQTSGTMRYESYCGKSMDWYIFAKKM